jgi:hypothetical protein
MIRRHPVARDPDWYLAWPDLALLPDGTLVCVFSCCVHHGDRSRTAIRCLRSRDRGRSWDAPVEPVAPTCGSPYWNNPRLSVLDDGRLVLLVDRIAADGRDGCRVLMAESRDAGLSWTPARELPVEGIVPDRLLVCRHGPHAGRWLVAAHRPLDGGRRSVERVWRSDDRGATWQGPAVIAERDDLWLCEGSLVELPDGLLVCLMRENSMRGLDAYKSMSSDGGLTWSEAVAFPLPGCHRPVAGLLAGGAEALVTFRLCQGGKGWLGAWTQNACAALCSVESLAAPARTQATTRIMPLDYDRSPAADCGYTGWVQYPDGEIVVVNYCVDDAPKGQIRCYAFTRDDLVLPAG